MKKIFIYIALLAILVFGFKLFYKEKETTNKKVVVAEVTHSVFYAPFYVSIHKNYFKEENIDLEVILTSGADKVASAVLSGDANIGLSGLEATLYVYDNNQKDYLVNFNALTKRDGQFLFGDCKYKDDFKLEDLIGKTVLVGRKSGMPSMVFNYGLHKNNINEVIQDTSVDFAGLSGAYIGKQADFVNLFEPTALTLEKQGYGCVLTSVGLMAGEVPYTVFHTKKSYLNDNKDIIKSFTFAINKGLEFVTNNDSNTIAKTIQEEFPNTTINDLEKAIQRYKDADSWWNNTYIKESAYNNLIELMKYNKSLNKEIDFKTIVNNSFNE